MSGCITLLGSEQVEGAAASMARSAENMQQAANQFDSSVHMLLRGLDEKLAVLEQILDQQRGVK